MALDLLAQCPDRAALLPFILLRLEETRGPSTKLDLPGLGLGSIGLVAIVWALIRANDIGWTSPQIIGAFILASTLLASFAAWELRTEHPLLPMRFFRNRTFALANLASLIMFFGMFGSIFFIAQFFQTVQDLSPFQSGLRILPWTAMPMFVAPIAGAVSDRIGGHRLMGAGLTLQSIGLAWIAWVTTPDVPYLDFIGPFAISGLGNRRVRDQAHRKDPADLAHNRLPAARGMRLRLLLVHPAWRLRRPERSRITRRATSSCAGPCACRRPLTRHPSATSSPPGLMIGPDFA